MEFDNTITDPFEDNGKLCRLCLGNEAVFNIFSENSMIVMKLQHCSSLQIYQNDGLPENICSSCVTTMDVSYNFRKLCEDTDKILRNNIHLIKTQIKKEVDVKFECDDYENYEISSFAADPELSDSIKHEGSKSETEPRVHKIKIKKRKKTLSEVQFKKILKRKKRESKLETNKKGFSATHGGLCPYCGKVFLKMATFNAHVKKHTLTESFSCETCQKKFKELRRLKDHERIHLNIREYSCEVCGKLFGTKSCAKKHLERVHLRSQVEFCKVCNKKLATMNSLRCHMKIHTGERTFECDVCTKKFAFKCSLLVHMRCHTGEKPYTCKFCGSKFAALKTIREHERLHTGETPYLCPVCFKGFTQKSNMKSHFRNNHKTSEIKFGVENLL